jgi:phosphopantetheinyl transferase
LPTSPEFPPDAALAAPVLVWWFPLPFPDCEGWAVTLPAPDHAVLAGLRREEVRRRTLHTRIVRRALYAALTGVAPEDQVDGLGEDGKPRAADGRAHFNLSHADGLAAVVLSRAGPVGVDVESAARTRDFPGLARRFFHPAEIAAWEQEGATPAAFLRRWTAKEALLKADGAGIRLTLSEVDTTAAAHDRPWRGFRCAALPLPAPFVGAVAAAAVDRVVVGRCPSVLPGPWSGRG